MPNPLIELRGISKHFFTQEVETRALSEVSLCIEQGEFLALSGPSGCGKSTLLALLGLLDVPTRGSGRPSVTSELVSSFSRST